MPIIESVTLQGYVTGLETGQFNIGPITFPTPATPTNATTQQQSFQLANGDNTVVPPSFNCTGCIVIFDPASTTIKRLKGSGADTGMIVNPTGFLVLTWTTGAAASFVLNSNAVDTGHNTTVIFL
jgi:hypothetical protein